MSCAQGTKLMGFLANHNDLTNSPKSSIFPNMNIYLQERLVRGLDTTHTHTKNKAIMFLWLVQYMLAATCWSGGSQVACQADTSAICTRPREKVFLGFWSLLSLDASEVQVGLLFQSRTEKPDKNWTVQWSTRLEGELPEKWNAAHWVFFWKIMSLIWHQGTNFWQIKIYLNSLVQGSPLW